MAVPFVQTFCTVPENIEATPRPKFAWLIDIKPEMNRHTLHLESPTFYTKFGEYQMTLDTARMAEGKCRGCGKKLHHIVWIYERRIVVPYEKDMIVEERSDIKRYSFELKKGAEGEAVEICSRSFELFYHEFIALSQIRNSSRLEIVVTVELPPVDIAQRIIIPAIHIRRDLCEYFHELWWSGEGADVNFVVEGQIIRAHREILAASSSKFREKLRGEASPDYPCWVKVHEVQANAFQVFLRCIYTGQVDNIDRWCSPLLMLAQRYKVECVKQVCINFMKIVKENSNPGADVQRLQMEHAQTRARFQQELERTRERKANEKEVVEEEEEEGGKDDPSVQEENTKNSKLGTEESASTNLELQYIIPLENPGASFPGEPDEPPPPYRSPDRASLPADGPDSGDGRGPSPPPTYSSNPTVQVGQQAPVASTSGSTSATSVAAAPPLSPTLPPALAPTRRQPRRQPRPARPARPAVPTDDILPGSKPHLKNWFEIQKGTVGTEGSRASSASRRSTVSATSRPSTPISLPSNKAADSDASVATLPPIPPAELTYLKLDTSALLLNRTFPAPRVSRPPPSVPAEDPQKSPEPEARSINEMKQEMNGYPTKTKGASFAERVQSVSQTRRPEGLEQRLLSTVAADVAPVVPALPVVEDPKNDTAATRPTAAAAATATSSTGTTKKKGKKKKGKKNNKPASSDAKPSLDDGKVETVDDGKDGEKKTMDSYEDAVALRQRLHNEYQQKIINLSNSKQKILTEIIKVNSVGGAQKKMVSFIDSDFEASLREADEARKKAAQAELETANGTNKPGGSAQVFNSLLAEFLAVHSDQISNNEEKSNEKEDSPEADDSNSFMDKLVVAMKEDVSLTVEDSKEIEASGDENETEDCDKNDDRCIEEDRKSIFVFEETEASEKTYKIEAFHTTDNSSEIRRAVRSFFKDSKKIEAIANEISNETKKTHESLTSSTLPKEAKDPEDEEKSNEKKDCDKTDDRSIDEARTSFQDSEETKASEEVDSIEVSDTTKDESEMCSVVRGTSSSKISETSETSENEEKSKEMKQSHKSNDCNGAENSTSSTVSKEAEAPEDEEKANEKEDSDESDDCKLELEDSLDSSRTISVIEESIQTLEETDNIDIDNMIQAVEIRDVLEASVSFKVSKKSEASNEADEQVEKSEDVKVSQKSEDSKSADDFLESKNFEETNGSISKENSKETEASNEADEQVEKSEDVKVSQKSEDSKSADDSLESKNFEETNDSISKENSKETEASNEADEQVEKSEDVKVSQKSEDSKSADDSLESKNFEETNDSINKENSKETEASNEIKDAAENEDSNKIEEPVPTEAPLEYEDSNEVEELESTKDPQEYEDSNEVEEPVLAEDPQEYEDSNEVEESVPAEEPQECENSNEVEEPVPAEEPQECENSYEVEEPVPAEDPQEYEDSNEVEESVPAEEPQECENSYEVEEPVPAEDPQEYEDSNEVKESVPAKEPWKIENSTHEEHFHAIGEYIDDSYKLDLFYKYVEKWDLR
ncbi:hypothetical protein TKK_0000063 [Trichogramma kaykai]|uniref:BTB domain-containing protein n=1 Tax=Trichogramma kaykai TaxID=54128 RepID=A0ABD2VUR3_9HYME